MTTRSVTWVARRIELDEFDSVRAMVRALGLGVLVDEPGKLVLTDERGDVVEYLAPDRALPAYLFEGQDTAVGFLVDDLDAALAACKAAGLPRLGEPGEGGGVRFAHVRGPAGVAYGLVQQN